MPKGVDECIWRKAKKMFKKSYGRSPKTSKDWKIMMIIYKRIKKPKKKNNSNKIMNRIVLFRL